MSNELPRTFKVVTIWLLLGVLVFVGIQWFLREQQQMRFRAEGDIIEIRRGADGHYHWPGTHQRSQRRLPDRHRRDRHRDLGRAGARARPAVDRPGAVEHRRRAGHRPGRARRRDLQGGVRAERLRLVALPALAERPLLGMDVLGRLHWQQRDGVMRIDLRPTQPS